MVNSMTTSESIKRIHYENFPLELRGKYCEIIENHVYDKLQSVVLTTYNANVSMLLCVSGGSDSMAMLHLLSKVRDRVSEGSEGQQQLHLEVINFNHKQRIESDEEV